MATIEIGGRTLDVKPCTYTMLEDRVQPFWATIGAEVGASSGKIPALAWAHLAAFLGHNEGVSAEWIRDSLPVTVSVWLTIFDVEKAAGLRQEKAESSGEAPAQ